MSDRAENLLAALALGLTDAIRTATEEASGHGMSGAAALATVTAFPGEAIDGLARIIGLSPAGCSRLVDKLEGEHLVRREGGSQDGRSRSVVPTETGTARARTMHEARRRAVLRALEALNHKQRDQLVVLLEAMLRALTPDRRTCDRICRLCDIAACPQHRCPVERAALASEQGRSP